jgi:hypothetical protein
VDRAAEPIDDRAGLAQRDHVGNVARRAHDNLPAVQRREVAAGKVARSGG